MTTTNTAEHPTVVVGIDGSEQSKQALRWARYLAAPLGAQVEAVAVWHLPAGYGAVAVPEGWNPKQDMQDVLAGVDHAVKLGIADPDRLGIGGWSYGAILTDAIIARDTRFKAAISGAGSGNMYGMYGDDEYAHEYEIELGTPWGNREAWDRASYPFLHADRIATPTLFQCGERDFNVPCIGAEQMYQALRSLKVPTGLVVYPGQHHGITVPSYLRDRMQRNLAWYDRFLKPAGSGP